MKILIAHNTYQQGGGEDVVAATEARLLSERGHQIIWYRRGNEELRAQGAFQTLVTGLKSVWASDSYRELAALLRGESPDVAHFHNTFPLISPAAYYACTQAGVPVVQTLHNYRLLCPGATFFRDGHICDQCLGRRTPWPGIVHRCYRKSAFASAAAAGMLTAHRWLGSWRTKVGIYIAASEFARGKFIRGGLPASRIRVKPNFVHPDPGVRCGAGKYALFVGRLCEEKGARVLLNAWRQLASPVPLIVAGDGPVREDFLPSDRELQGNISVLSTVSHDEVLALMRGARFLVFPSLVYEGAFPLAIVEAFACGLPVVASRLGSIEEGTTHGRNSLHFSAGNCEELAKTVVWAWQHPQKMEEFGRAARLEYEARYTADLNYEILMEIYSSVRRTFKNGRRSDFSTDERERPQTPLHETREWQ